MQKPKIQDSPVCYNIIQAHRSDNWGKFDQCFFPVTLPTAAAEINILFILKLVVLIYLYSGICVLVLQGRNSSIRIHSCSSQAIRQNRQGALYLEVKLIKSQIVHLICSHNIIHVRCGVMKPHIKNMFKVERMPTLPEPGNQLWVALGHAHFTCKYKKVVFMTN